jgi:hypothetical protein
MAVDDLWYSSKRLRGDDGKLLPPEPTKRHGRGKRYRVRWVDDAGKPQTRLFDRKADADRFDANVHADLSRGQYVDPAAGKVRVAEYSAAWRANQLHRASTAELMERAFRLHINPILGGMEIARVRPSNLKACTPSPRLCRTGTGPWPTSRRRAGCAVARSSAWSWTTSPSCGGR